MNDIPKVLYILSAESIRLVKFRAKGLHLGGYHYLLGISGIVVITNEFSDVIYTLLNGMIDNGPPVKVVIEKEVGLNTLHNDRITELNKRYASTNIVRDLEGEEAISELINDIKIEIGEGEPRAEREFSL